MLEENQDIFYDVCDLDHLLEAYHKSAPGSDWKWAVQRCEENLLIELQAVVNDLLNDEYRQKPLHEFVLNERGKTRDIKAFNIIDRVVQRWYCDNFLMPCLTKYCIYDNGASLKGKGESFTRKRLVAHISQYYRENKSNDGWVLKIDFSKFFDNIDHDNLYELILSKLNSEKAKELFVYLIEQFNVDVSYLTDEEYQNIDNVVFNSLEYPPVSKDKLIGEKIMRRSVGIGGQPSQYCGLVYPVKIDTYCKCVKSIKYYGRYMDDIYIISSNKEYLKQLLSEISEICKECGIFLNQKKTQIIKLSHGFTFMNVRYILTESGHIVKIPDKKNFTRMRRKLKKLKQKVLNDEIPFSYVEEMYSSWRGNMKRFDCYRSLKRMDALYNELYSNIKEELNEVRSNKA